MKLSRIFAASIGLALGVVTSLPAFAHEVIIVPEKVENGKLAVSVESTHFYVKPEEAENPAAVDAYLLSAEGQRQDIPLMIEGLSLKGQADAPQSWGWLVAHRVGQVWANTPDGWKEGTRNEFPDAVSVNRYEKFTKHLIGSPVDGAAVTKPLNFTLEIVPETDPSKLQVGQELAVKVLHNGMAIASKVRATYAGFSEAEETYAQTLDTENGLAKVKLSSPGLWFVRAEYKPKDKQEGVDYHVLRTILSFSVAK